MRLLFLFYITCSFLVGCTRNLQKDPECAAPAIVPFQPYSDPVWHPNGQLLGFNHTPQTGVAELGTRPCSYFMNGVKQDSAGFYLINRDGSGFRRVTRYKIGPAAWSPDGNWLAFSMGTNLYKMRFDGSTFDTAHIVQLTTTGGNFFSSWTANSDSLYFDSNANAPAGTAFYAIWKMAADGSGKSIILQSNQTGDIRQPYVINDKVYYVGYISGKQEVFSMNKDGSNPTQITFNSKGAKSPKVFQSKVYFENGAINLVTNNSALQLAKPVTTYAISTAGEIVFSKWDYSVNINDKQRGALWIMNSDGSNQRQLTFN